MKYYIILAGIVFLTLSSCEDLLEKPSKTELSTSIYFKTQGDFETAINGAYQQYRTLYNASGNGNNGAVLMGEMHSDNSRYSYNMNFRATPDQENIADFIYIPNNSNQTQKYRTNFQIIARANHILFRIDEIDFDQSAKDNIKGQALFLRAYSYFDLVQYFGKVPLHLVPSTGLEDVALPLAEVDEVYDQIINDASTAAGLMPAKANQAPGRASSDAAYTLLGNVYIVRQEWANAEAALLQVNGSLMNDYAAIFHPANKGNSELIFEAQFSQATDDLACNFMQLFFPNPITRDEVIAIYEDNGLDIPDEINGLDRAGINIPTPDLISTYEDGDLRRDATIGFGMANGKMMPYAKKYLHPHDYFFRMDSNWPIYRYAEVLLFLAEAINEQGGRSGEVLNYLNEVHAHSRTGLSPVTETDQSQLRDIILHERRVELALENKRWLDLVRMDIVEQVIRPYGDRIRANPEAYYFPPGIELRTNAFQDFSKTFPLPADEALLSPYF